MKKYWASVSMVPPDLLTGTTMVSSGLRDAICASRTSASTLSRIHSHGPSWLGRSCCGKKAFWSARVPSAEPPMPRTTMCLKRCRRGVSALSRVLRLLRKGRFRNGSLPAVTSPISRAVQLSSCGASRRRASGCEGAVSTRRPVQAWFQSSVCIPFLLQEKPPLQAALFRPSGPAGCCRYGSWPLLGAGGGPPPAERDARRHPESPYLPIKTLRTRSRASMSTSSATA